MPIAIVAVMEVIYYYTGVHNVSPTKYILGAKFLSIKKPVYLNLINLLI